jgi:serine/threonine protein kinase
VVGKTLAHYEIREKLGAGGMGEVYLAHDRKLRRDVALKVLPAELAADEDRRRRLVQEARAVAALNHPNIVTLHAIEEDDGVHFLIMELVRGAPLHNRLSGEPLVLDELLSIALQLTDALGAAHEAGIVHRDLKPTNVMLSEDGRVKVLDFGLAFIVESEPEGETSDLQTRTQLANAGGVAGTIPYMSPEQVEVRPVDPRSDIFSLGILLYEFATGKRPFEGETATAIASSILKDLPPPESLLNRELPAELGRVIARCLEKDPADRFATARELHAELATVGDPTAGTPSVTATTGPGGGQPLFSHDLFISYAHLDNEAQLTGQQGWVTAFHRSLEVRVGQLVGKKPDIWRDPKTRGEEGNEDTQFEHLPKSALLISVLSPRYAKSEWCTRELKEFVKAAARTGGPKWGTRYRVFKVVKTPTPVDRHPPEIQSLLGYEFYKVDPETGRPRELDQIFGPEAQRDYWARLDDLAHDIADLLENLDAASAPISQDSHPSSPSVEDKGVIYLAQTTHDLRDEHDAMRRDLQRHGFTILPDGALPMLDAELRQRVREDLERARMSIHLVGSNYGIVAEGSTESVVTIQNEMAVERAGERGFERVVWIPHGLEINDERQQGLVNTLRTDPAMHRCSDLLETPLEDLKTVVLEKLAPRKRALEPTTPAATDEPSVPRVYMICDQRDQDAVAPLSDFLFECGFEVTLPIFEGDEADVREDHEENLRLCDAVLVYYGNGNELWLRRKLREVAKSVGLGRTRVMKAKGIWVAPPVTQQKERLRTHDALVMSQPDVFATDELKPFVDALKTAS